MIIAESKEYDVIFKVCKDYRRKNIYMVVYGLQVGTFDNFYEASDEYHNSVVHAVECNGILGDYL